MKQFLFSGSAAALATLGLISCEPQQLGGDTLNATQQKEATAARVAAQGVEPPPMIARTAAYRCDDGRALYVDILTDDNIVNVRDSRQDIPVRLTRDEETQIFGGENISLSGRGDEVRYSSPERPGQSCRIGSAGP